MANVMHRNGGGDLTDSDYVRTLRRIEHSRFEIERPDRELETAEGDVGTSSSASSSEAAHRLETFRVYFKSFVWNSLDAPIVGGIGIAICDLEGNFIFELGKPMPGNDRNRLGADCSALIEGLNAALSLNLTRIRGRWRPKQSKIRALVNQVSLLRNKFASLDEVLVPRKDIKHAVKLAREAIDAQLNQPPESSSTNPTLENCVTCLDNKPSTEMFQTTNCSHRYCFSCMKHVEAKLLIGLLPKCINEKCNSELTIESCQVFLRPKFIEMLRHRIKESSIPETEKFYCPFPKCSVLMSIKNIMYQKNILENLKDTNFVSRQNEARRCVECKNVFCIRCRVPWHENLSCSEYERLNHGLLTEELKLMNLAHVNQWRQCNHCSNMIELAEGCYHMVCRCGYEFCYKCGDEWNYAGTCSC